MITITITFSITSVTADCVWLQIVSAPNPIH